MGINKISAAHFAAPAFHDLKSPASFSARKCGSKSLIASLGFTSTTARIHPTYFTTHGQNQHSQKSRFNLVISALDGIQDKIKLCLRTIFSRRRR